MGKHGGSNRQNRDGDRPIPGWSFDNQWNESKRRGQERAARGEGPWSIDKQLNDLRYQNGGEGSSGGGGNGKEGCADKAVALLGLLAGAGWVLNELVRYVA